jgi:hypothetical protein
MILRMCRTRGAGKSICPSEVARALDADEGAWRALMPDVRRVAGDLASRGLIAVTQRDRSVDAASSRGAIRLALPSEPKTRSRKK